ncbi:dihydrofolate reductase [Paenibacillus sediminis]|uniref:Dihydrofolate reductase n=1 Tax=Paenibacillus sediminis TaxID=664909 RepID=A0ABS4H0Y4_9BACL|nr:dihydrofolate reductase [Paenibacillus sediminis]MBP1935932.1 dihydrofolate reductase [Paenibacillus sediminis]
MSVSLIWAMAQNGIIGVNNRLPWRLPADMAFFKAQTTGKTIVMGRKTWDSLGGKPLPNRHNLVLTRDSSFQANGAEVVHSIEEALTYAERGELMVIGGAHIYEQFLPYADKLIVTIIHHDFEGDTKFPPVNWDEFEKAEEIRGTRDERNDYDYDFVTFIRKM